MSLASRCLGAFTLSKEATSSQERPRHVAQVEEENVRLLHELSEAKREIKRLQLAIARLQKPIADLLGAWHEVGS